MADRYTRIDLTNSQIKAREGIDTFTGPVDVGKLVALAATGKIDPSLIPAVEDLSYYYAFSEGEFSTTIVPPGWANKVTLSIPAMPEGSFFLWSYCELAQTNPFGRAGVKLEMLGIVPPIFGEVDMRTFGSTYPSGWVGQAVFNAFDVITPGPYAVTLDVNRPGVLGTAYIRRARIGIIRVD